MSSLPLGVWELRKHQDVRGHHELREAKAQRLTQPRDIHGAVPRNHVGNEALIAGRVFAHGDHASCDARILRDDGFDLRQLHAVPAHLDLVIPTPQVLEHTVFAKTRPIPGAVHPAEPREGIRDESLLRELVAKEVAARNAVTRDGQLARRAHRNRLSARIEDIDPRIGDGPANRDGRLVVSHLVRRRPHRRFGRSVHVE